MLDISVLAVLQISISTSLSTLRKFRNGKIQDKRKFIFMEYIFMVYFKLYGTFVKPFGYAEVV